MIPPSSVGLTLATKSGEKSGLGVDGHGGVRILGLGDGTDDCGPVVSERAKFLHAAVGGVGGHAGEETSRGLGVEDEGVARVEPGFFLVSNRASQPNVRRLERACRAG